jgi:DNA polymerase-3 subunit alpha
MSKFVHLSVHTEYSLSDSTIRIPKLIQDAADKGMSAVAMTDTTNIFGGIRFYTKARDAKIKPIIGSELVIEHPEHGISKITVLCKDNFGYKNLMKLISEGYDQSRVTEGEVPTLSIDLLSHYSSGLIALSGAQEGAIGKLLMANKYSDATDLAIELRSIFNGEFYLELQRTGHPYDDDHVELACELAADQGIPVVATNKVRFREYGDHKSHEIRRAISSSMTVDQLASESDLKRELLCTPEQYLKSPEEMEQLFSDIPSAITNTARIAEKCNIDIELNKNYLPSFPVPKGMTEARFLEIESLKGLNQRLDFLYGANNPDMAEIRKPYDERLTYELNIVNQMGFPGYFLIVSDFIRWSKENDIPVGPGRGSGAGSLVAYSLQITDLDPLHYDLLFERFLNPERVSMPDFDVDFCMENRDRVIDYVAQKYGRKAVSQIITYGTMAAKSVLRDVARALGKPYSVGDRIARMIPDEPGIKLSTVMDLQLEFQTLYQNDSEAKEVIDHAMVLEGLTRQTGKHAGGVLIAPSTLTEFTPTYTDADGKSGFVSQYDKDDVEKAGLVKFDFLGLRTLTIIHKAVKAINKSRVKKNEGPIEILGIDLKDEKSYELIKKCQTTAVFQLESRGMKNLIHRLEPNNIEEIIALVALFRPGPLQAGMVDDFVNRKHGLAEINYPHPMLEPILENTYGVFVYQEQVMQTAQTLAGYSLGQADMLRRAMGKKKPEEMEKQRELFTSGSVKNGIPEATATAIFNLMEKFAGYGFNKSHSAAYGLIAFQTAWLKAHYPAEFMAAVLSSDMSNTDKVVGFIHESKVMGIDVLPPDINNSKREFIATPDGKILYGIEAIKGIGESAVSGILAERDENGEFKSLHDFCARCNPHKRVVEAAIKAGLLDRFGLNRATLMENWEKARAVGKQIRKEDSNLTGDLFGEIMDEKDLVEITEMPDWAVGERLRGERKTLGLFLTGHPIEEYEEELKTLVDGPISDFVQTQLDEDQQKDIEKEVEATHGRKKIKVAGIVTDIQIKVGKTGHNCFITLDDGTGQIATAIFNKEYNNAQHYLTIDSPVVIEGELRKDRRTNEQKLIAHKVQSVEVARNHTLKSVNISASVQDLPKDQRVRLGDLLSHAEVGGVAVTVVTEKDGKRANRSITEQGIVLSDDILREFRKMFGDENVALTYSTDATKEDLNTEAEMKKFLAIEGRKTAADRHNKIAQILSEARQAFTEAKM